MNKPLSDAIAAVASERSGGMFNEAFGAAARLAGEYGEQDLAERIATEVPESVSWEVVADLLGILEWSTKDNGSSIRRQAEHWLIQAQDTRRILIALHLEALPFTEAAQMEEVLSRLAASNPLVASRCHELIRQRRAIEGLLPNPSFKRTPDAAA